MMRTVEKMVYLDTFQLGFKLGFNSHTTLVTLLSDLWNCYMGIVCPSCLRDLSVTQWKDHGIFLIWFQGLMHRGHIQKVNVLVQVPPLFVLIPFTLMPKIIFHFYTKKLYYIYNVFIHVNLLSNIIPSSYLLMNS